MIIIIILCDVLICKLFFLNIIKPNHWHDGKILTVITAIEDIAI